MIEHVAGSRSEAADRLHPLPRTFFERPTDEVAHDLLGALLCRATGEGLTVGRIVETEAYGGPEDRASHARAGRTRRTTPMFGQVGHAYVYVIYGMHDCLNVVAYSGADAGAVLLRSLEPLEGVDLMRRRRGRARDPDARLCAGPARLCQAMAVDRTLESHDLTTGEGLWLAAPAEGASLPEFAEGERIGVDYATDGWADRPWRFWLASHPSVSRR